MIGFFDEFNRRTRLILTNRVTYRSVVNKNTSKMRDNTFGFF